MAEAGQPAAPPGPLQPGDLDQIEATLLPALERHHLRLLVHGLRTLQAIDPGAPGVLPGAAAIEAWAARQPLLAADPGFAASFQGQLLALAGQLAAIAAETGRPPLELGVVDLIAWARRQADGRLSSPGQGR